jgi:magnesium transporter
MIEILRFIQGVAEPEPVEPSDLPDARRGPGTLLIIEVVDFTDVELDLVAAAIPIHQLALDDLRTANQRTKLVRYGDHYHVAVHQADTSSHHLVIREVDVVFGEDWLLVVRQPVEGDVPMDLDEVKTRFRRVRMIKPECDLGYAIWALLDVVVDGYFDVTELIDERLDSIEDVIFREEVHDATPKQVFDLRRKIVDFRRAANPIREVLGTILRHEIDWISGEPLALMREVADHALRVGEMIESQRELLTGLLDAHLAIVSNRMNDVMKKTSSYGAILLVSTLIAGIYGMNFEYMPELDFKFGYFVALALMAIATAVLWWRFKKRGWL